MHYMYMYVCIYAFTGKRVKTTSGTIGHLHVTSRINSFTSVWCTYQLLIVMLKTRLQWLDPSVCLDAQFMATESRRKGL